jgi:2-iminobutanoate/2-iminopropanoate deaminase
VFETVYTDQAPKPVGQCSQATASGGLVFVAMQLPLDPASGKIISGDIALRTHQAMSNVYAVLQASGSRLQDIVRLTTYVTDLQGIEDIRAVFRGYFSQNLPAMTLIQVAALPLGAEVAIEAIAVQPGGERDNTRESI